MYTFKDYDTNELVSFDSLDALTLIEATDYVSGEPTACIVEVDGVRHRVYEDFYNKVKEDKGL